MMQPLLYTFRRCPYAIRARYTLDYAGVACEQHEVDLKNKPPVLLELSPKGTVPVLLLSDGRVLDESYDIMRWAAGECDPDGLYPTDLQSQIDHRVEKADQEFKPLIDAYKYADRLEHSQEEFARKGEKWLTELDQSLHRNHLLGVPTLADIALFPFVRQFRGVDPERFDAQPFNHLHQWLQRFLSSERFERVMAKKLPT